MTNDEIDAVFKDGEKTAEEIRGIIAERVAKFGRAEIRGTTITANKNNDIKLNNLAHPDCDVVFENVVFKGKLWFDSSRFSTLILDNCEFEPAVKTKNSAVKTENDFSLDLSSVQARRIFVKLKNRTFEENKQEKGNRTFLLSAKGCEVSSLFEISRDLPDKGKTPSLTETTVLNLEGVRVGQDGFGGDLVIKNDANNDKHKGMTLLLNRTRVRGDLLIEGCQELATPLALNASELRVSEELRLRNICFIDTQQAAITTQKDAANDAENPFRPAINLMRAQIGRLVLHDDIVALFPKKTNVIDWDEFTNIENIQAKTLGLTEISIDRVGFIHTDNIGTSGGNSEFEGKFWRNFVANILDPEHKIIDEKGEIKSLRDDNNETETRRFRRTLVEFADALEEGRAGTASDMLRVTEKDLEIRSGNIGIRSLNNAIKLVIASLMFLIPCLSILFATYDQHLTIGSQNFASILLYLFVATPIWLLVLSRTRRKTIQLVVSLFRRISFNAIADGISPLNVLAYVLALWCLACLVFTAAAYRGYMAPDFPEIFHRETELMNMQEISELDEIPLAYMKKMQGVVTPHDFNLAELSYRAGLYPKFDELQRISALKGLDKENVNKYYWNIPFTAFHAACRSNWARPSMIEKDEWSKVVMSRYAPQVPLSKSEQKLLLQNMKFEKICERLLPAEYSMFEPGLYALDIVIPLLDLRQEDQWSVRVSKPHEGTRDTWGTIIVVLEALFITVGWLFALVIAGAITGLSDPNRRPN